MSDCTFNPYSVIDNCGCKDCTLRREMNAPPPEERAGAIRETAFRPTVVDFKANLTYRQQFIQDDILRVLQGYLSKAKRGELTGLFIVASDRENGGVHAWSETDNYCQVLGAIASAQHSYVSHGSITSTVHDPDIDGQPEKDA